MKYKGIIFDFNGVLLLDTPWHNEAWNEMSLKIRGRSFTEDEMHHNVHGRTNKEILSYLFGKSITQEEASKDAETKEKLYQNIALSKGQEFNFSRGAIELLDMLVKHAIPHTIATSSSPMNLNFYIQHLDLKRWFNLNEIVFDNGDLPSKPAPDIYIKASEKIRLRPTECIVVEDSKSGILAALNAKAGKVIGLATSGNHEDLKNIQRVSRVISKLEEITFDDFLS
jgi:beta-phosphoglucomutase-like phosphatase (HAD superfamily)